MRVSFKLLIAAVVTASLVSAAFGQLAYSVSDNNRDATGLAQQYYEIDLATGVGRLIQTLDDGMGNPVIRREYEGLASAGSVLFGVSEFDTELCNTGSDPVTGLAADVRLFTADGVGPQIGETGDTTAVGDYTGDEKAGFAFYRPSNSTWYVLRSEDSSFFAFPWGAVGDGAAPGDYDGDGTTDAAVFRESDLTWYILGSTSGFEAVQFGSAGDQPVPSVFSRTAP